MISMGRIPVSSSSNADYVMSPDFEDFDTFSGELDYGSLVDIGTMVSDIRDIGICGLFLLSLITGLLMFQIFSRYIRS